MLNFLDKLPSNTKNYVAISYDIIIAAISFPLALFIRLGHIDFISEVDDLFLILSIILICKIIALAFYKSYKGIWRFASTNDLIQIAKTITTSTLVAMALIFLWNRMHNVPRSAFMIDWFLNIFLMGGARFSFRMWKENKKHMYGKKTLIIGAGNAGEQIVRDIKRASNTEVNIIGLLDDAETKKGRTLHGIPVLGTTFDLATNVKKYDIEQIFIAIPTASSKIIRRIVNTASELGIAALTLPSINDVVGGKVQISQLRPVKIEDLLGRDPIKLDNSAIASMVNNKTILVTGAGGSIGSELCNQILKFGPKKLVLFEQCEFFIYKTHMELSEKYPSLKIVPVVGDIRETERLEEVFTEHRPEIVFHAAAYKHVPMMELNPKEAIKTNVFGTKNVANVSIKHGVSKFVMISTDKAVNPTNVMGATKRTAEQVCQALSQIGETKFAIVRFGNVLGSAGSVVPRFMEQIKAGGPVTVTHPEINRFFMSIPEACQLVLQAGALSNGGEIFVLDMGEPVKIVDLARDLIKFSGANEDEIEIKFTGLRPGEKLYEELLADKEGTLPTPHEKIRIARATSPNESFISQIDKLLTTSTIKETIKEIVPEYNEAQI